MDREEFLPEYERLRAITPEAGEDVYKAAKEAQSRLVSKAFDDVRWVKEADGAAAVETACAKAANLIGWIGFGEDLTPSQVSPLFTGENPKKDLDGLRGILMGDPDAGRGQEELDLERAASEAGAKASSLVNVEGLDDKAADEARKAAAIKASNAEYMKYAKGLATYRDKFGDKAVEAYQYGKTPTPISDEDLSWASSLTDEEREANEYLRKVAEQDANPAMPKDGAEQMALLADAAERAERIPAAQKALAAKREEILAAKAANEVKSGFARERLAFYAMALMPDLTDDGRELLKWAFKHPDVNPSRATQLDYRLQKDREKGAGENDYTLSKGLMLALDNPNASPESRQLANEWYFLDKFTNLSQKDRHAITPILAGLRGYGNMADTAGGAAWNAFVRGFTDTAMGAVEGAESFIRRACVNSEDYQRQAEVWADVRNATEENAYSFEDALKKKDGTWGAVRGYVYDSIVSASGSLPYMAIAGTGPAGVVAIALQERQKMEDIVASQGGDVSSPEFMWQSALCAGAYAGVEYIAWEGLAGMFKTPEVARRGQIRLFQRLVAKEFMRDFAKFELTETLEEDIQDEIEQVFTDMKLDKPPEEMIRNAARTLYETTRQTLGSMAVTGAVGLGKRALTTNTRMARTLDQDEIVRAMQARREVARMMEEREDRTMDASAVNMDEYERNLGDITLGYLESGGRRGKGLKFLTGLGFNETDAKAMAHTIDTLWRSVNTSLDGDARDEAIRKALGGREQLSPEERIRARIPAARSVKPVKDGAGNVSGYDVDVDFRGKDGNVHTHKLHVTRSVAVQIDWNDEQARNDLYAALQSDPNTRGEWAEKTIDDLDARTAEERAELNKTLANPLYARGFTRDGQMVLGIGDEDFAIAHESFHDFLDALVEAGELTPEERAAIGTDVNMDEEGLADLYEDLMRSLNPQDVAKRGRIENFLNKLNAWQEGKGSVLDAFRAERKREIDIGNDFFNQIANGNWRGVTWAKRNEVEKKTEPTAERALLPSPAETETATEETEPETSPSAEAPQSLEQNGKEAETEAPADEVETWRVQLPDGTEIGGEVTVTDISMLVLPEGATNPLTKEEMRDLAMALVEAGPDAMRLNVDYNGVVQSPPWMLDVARLVYDLGYGDRMREAAARGNWNLGGMTRPVVVERVAGGTDEETKAKVRSAYIDAAMAEIEARRQERERAEEAAAKAAAEAEAAQQQEQAKQEQEAQPTPKPSVTAKRMDFSYKADDYEKYTGDATGAAFLTLRNERGAIIPLPAGFADYWREYTIWRKAVNNGWQYHGQKAGPENRPRMQAFGVADTALADWCAAFLDGRTFDDAEVRFLFGRGALGAKAVRGGDSGNYLAELASLAPGLAGEVVENGDGTYDVDSFLDAALDAYRKYADWRQGKSTARKEGRETLTAEERHWQEAEEEEEADRRDAIRAWDDAIRRGEAIDMDDIGAAIAQEYDNAVGFVYDEGSEDWRPFDGENLSRLRDGDWVQWDGETEAFRFSGYDAGNGVLTITSEETGRTRTFEVTDDAILETTAKEESDNGNRGQTETRPDDDLAGNEAGEGGAREEEGGAGAEGDFALESATPEQIEAERERARVRAEIERRLNERIVGGVVNVQENFDLGDGGRGDLFDPTTRYSLVTRAEDAAYMDAVNRGDMETAARMVREAAAKMTNPSPEVFHGTKEFGFTEFKTPVVFTSSSITQAKGYTTSYEGRRDIASSSIDTSTPEGTAKAVNGILGKGAQWRVATDADKAENYDKIAVIARRFYKKVLDADEANRGWEEKLPFDESYGVGEYSSPGQFDIASDIWQVLTIDWADNIASDGTEIFSGTEDNMRRYAAMNELERFSDQYKADYDVALKRVNDYAEKHWDEIKNAGLEWVFNLVQSYERGDLVIDSNTIAESLNPDGAMLTTTNESGETNWWSVDNAKAYIETASSGGVYGLVGDLGENPFEVDAQGSFWTNIKVPAWDGKVLTTDGIVEEAMRKGHTSVIIRNVVDPSKLGTNTPSDDYCFFGTNKVKSTDPVTYDDAGNVIPLSQRFNPAKEDIRYSLARRGDDSLSPRSYGANTYLTAMIATDILRGIDRSDAEYERLAASLHAKLPVADARDRAAQAIARDGRRAVREAVPREQMKRLAKGVEAAEMKNHLMDAATGGQRAGVDYGQIAERGAQRAKTNIRRDGAAQSSDYAEFLEHFGVDIAGMLTGRELDGPPADYPQAQKVQLFPVNVALDATTDERARTLLAAFKAWRENQDVWIRDAMEKAGGEYLGQSFPIPPELMEKAGLDLNSSGDLAAFLKVAVCAWIAESEGVNASVERILSNPLYARRYAVTMARLLRDLAQKVMDPKNAFAARQVERAIASLEADEVTPESVEKRTAAVIRTVNVNAVRQTRKAIIKDLREQIHKLAGVWEDSKIDELERDENRRVLGHVARMAKFVSEAIGYGAVRTAKEIAKAQKRMEEAAKAVDLSGRTDITAADLESYRRAAQELVALEQYGGLKDKAPAEIQREGLRIVEWLKNAYAEHEARWDAYTRENDAIQKPFAAGADNAVRRIEALEDFAELNLSSISDRLMLICRGAKGDKAEAAQRAIDEINYIINRAVQKRDAVKVRYENDLAAAIYDAVDGTGMSARDFVRHLGEKVDDEISRAITDMGDPSKGRRGQRHFNDGARDSRLTWGQVLYILSYLEQVQSYGRNIKLYGRENQAAYIRSVASSADLKFLRNLQGLMASHRGELSDSLMEITGFSISAPDVFYFPVHTYNGPGEGLDTEISGAFNPLAPYTPRRMHSKDVDESRDILSVYMESALNDAGIIAFGLDGMRLRSILTRKETMEAIYAGVGKYEAEKMRSQLTDIITDGRAIRPTAVDRMMQRLNSFATYTQLGFNANSALKQLASIPAWAGVLPDGGRNVVRYIMDFDWAAARELMDGDGFAARYGRYGWGRGMVAKVLSDPRLSWWGKAKQLSMTPIQFCDFVPGLMVATGLYKAQYEALRDRGLSPAEAKARAQVYAWQKIEESQQSSQQQNMNEVFRRAGVFGRAALKYANAPVLQESHVFTTARLALADPKNARKWGNFAATVAANHILMPCAMYAITTGFRAMLGQEPPEEWRAELITMMLLGSFGRIIMVGGILETGLRAIAGLPQKTGGDIPGFDNARRVEADVLGAMGVTNQFDAEAMGEAWSDLAKDLSPLLRHILTAVENWGE